MYTVGRFEAIRNTALLLNHYRNPPLFAAHYHSRDIHPLSSTEAAEQIEKEGFFDGLALRQEALAQLLEYSKNSVCYAEGERSLPLSVHSRQAAEQKYGRRIVLGRYLDCRSECAAVARLESDAMLRAIARA